MPTAVTIPDGAKTTAPALRPSRDRSVGAGMEFAGALARAQAGVATLASRGPGVATRTETTANRAMPLSRRDGALATQALGASLALARPAPPVGTNGSTRPTGTAGRAPATAPARAATPPAASSSERRATTAPPARPAVPTARATAPARAPAATRSTASTRPAARPAAAAKATAAPRAGTTSAATGADLVRSARALLGRPYVWGGEDPVTGMDCTGFTWWIARENGIDTPLHDLEGQMAAGPPVTRETLRPGDLVFFDDTYQPGLSHVGIYSGDGRFIHAASQRLGVIESRLDEPYWAERYHGATRLASR